ncbi:MAG: Alanine-tRNA ligase [Candidatus Wolfebacteria bacterium GW2011_GWA2_42_10]|uniref:alanine--tRNA ligase n=2 Tax=Candidatus Wolfeibacteriota TaxID=1752735 RepID=A0A0G0ZUD9_9BACT|nr:MAG: Alanine-tRNA ligase [Candidatus Wolfebacteria bacterium GW2011_GWB1_41_12]KKS25601.1 MAG: Alanine-tRNA ligase [Candidatus Wolfebacteria bacterium GW2011_GWA2_42_10]KKT56508.1 MAG: Alanine-tRNA ligase [Candidatus Wolfebacteria bacterium GW2011_GWA1_44_24]
MLSEEIRQSFLDFFKKKGHKIIPSSSLIPDDVSVLLTTAGMQQFKKYYTGELNALREFGSQRTASIQKCFRTTDIEEVGDRTHLTFFEMLGNFSFGPAGSDNPEDLSAAGYFKRSAIFWAYEFVADVLGINFERIAISVFKGDNEIPFDEESYKIWHDEIGLPKDKIILGERADNFWGPTGDEGPCGPSSEIYVDGVEIWNLVFNEYYKEKNGVFKKTGNLGVDTGMGFERLASVLQGKDDVFETDIFMPLIAKINELAPGLEQKIIRILADHLRSSIFLISDGVRPSNKETGYILRRLLRRILAYSVKYDIHADLFPETLEIINDKFGEIYPEIKKIKEILSVLEEERLKFEEAVSRGVKEIGKYPEIDGKTAFYLYETFGLPFELILELGPKEAVKNLGRKDFDKESQKHQEISRAGITKKFGGHGLILDTGELKAVDEEEMKKVIRLHTATHLLQWALREVLGNEVGQTGSDINAERLRFDFSFGRKMTTEEIKKTEESVNQKIQENLPVYFKEMPKSEAEKTGALRFFKTQYPEVVKVYFIGFISAEFCGGPHVNSTSEIGKFKITKEESVSAGTRRIKATLIS